MALASVLKWRSRQPLRGRRQRDSSPVRRVAPAPPARLHSTASASGRSGHWASGWPAVALVSALATLFSWKTSAWPPCLRGVNSWEAALSLGFTHHLQWGPQAVFTFGPYGFVENLLPFSRLTAGLGFVYALAITWGLAALIVVRVAPAMGAAAGRSGGVGRARRLRANLLEAPELALATALGLALASFRATTRPARLALLGGLGAWPASSCWSRSTSAWLLRRCLVVGRRRRAQPDGRRRRWSAPSRSCPCLTVALVSAGQSLGNLASYVRGSLSVALGYGLGHEPGEPGGKPRTGTRWSMWPCWPPSSCWP